MKNILIVSAVAILFYAGAQVCGCGSCSKANTPSSVIDSNEGINFISGTWSEAVSKSKAENKPIFLDVSTSWCGWCKVLKRKTFTDKEAATYFNANFINVEIDAEQGEGKYLAEKYQVNSYPTLIIIDNNEKVIQYSAGYLDAKGLISFGKSAKKNPN